MLEPNTGPARKMKHRKPSAKMIAFREKLLKQVGYTRMKERGLKSSRPGFPDLSVEVRHPTSDTVGNGFAKKPLPDDAKQFPIGHSHKQGLELILPGEIEWMGGKKP